MSGNPLRANLFVMFRTELTGRSLPAPVLDAFHFQVGFQCQCWEGRVIILHSKINQQFSKPSGMVVIRKSDRFLCVHKKDYPAKQPPSQPSIQPPNQPTTHPASHPTDQPNTRENGSVAKQLVISLISPSSLIITFDQFL